jgi:hypothetical protein
MKAAFVIATALLVAGSNARKEKSMLRANARLNQQMSLDVDLKQHMELEVQGKSEFQGASLVQDENHGFAFMGKWAWEGTPPKVKNAEGKEVDGPSNAVEFEFGVSFEPFVTPFMKITYKFASTFTQMFPKAWELVKAGFAKLADVPKIKEATAKAKSFKELAASIKSFAKEKWAKVKAKFPKLAEMLEGFNLDAGIGGSNSGSAANNAGSNGGFTPLFKFADTDNGGRPVFELEWRAKDANQLTSCCWDLVPAKPVPAPGTCGFTNQGLHAQLQLGNIDYLKAIFGAILPSDACDISKAPYKKSGKYDVAAIKDGIKKNFDITKAAKAAPKRGGKLAAAKMAAGKTIDTIKKALGTALKSATCTLRLELRVALFTVGIQNKLETGCWICKLSGGDGCVRSDGKACA